MYPNLRAEIARVGVSNGNLAKLLGIAPCTFSLKFSGKSDWTFSEACKLKKLLKSNMPLEVLFATERK